MTDLTVVDNNEQRALDVERKAETYAYLKAGDVGSMISNAFKKIDTIVTQGKINRNEILARDLAVNQARIEERAQLIAAMAEENEGIDIDVELPQLPNLLDVNTFPSLQKKTDVADENNDNPEEEGRYLVNLEQNGVQWQKLGDMITYNKQLNILGHTIFNACRCYQEMSKKMRRLDVNPLTQVLMVQNYFGGAYKDAVDNVLDYLKDNARPVDFGEVDFSALFGKYVPQVAVMVSNDKTFMVVRETVKKGPVNGVSVYAWDGGERFYKNETKIVNKIGKMQRVDLLAGADQISNLDKLEGLLNENFELNSEFKRGLTRVLRENLTVPYDVAEDATEEQLKEIQEKIYETRHLIEKSIVYIDGDNFISVSPKSNWSDGENLTVVKGNLRIIEENIEGYEEEDEYGETYYVDPQTIQTVQITEHEVIKDISYDDVIAMKNGNGLKM